MLLSELINEGKKALDKHGEMDVYLNIHYDKECKTCGQDESRTMSGITGFIVICNKSVSSPCEFHIDGDKY
ncbi:hypothetical protein LCGC14_3057180 [marine sediment metagenome]|uniref:Uncharacterized protein n=1 Tax=marine sediment metagenome TaxID=412755 RepID=A0A0F8X883_9ZZZZ